MKICKKCLVEKFLEDFPKGKGNAGGRGPVCKKCKYSRSKELIKNPEEFKSNIRERAKKSYHKHKNDPSKIAQRQIRAIYLKKYNADNKEKLKNDKHIYYLDNQEYFKEQSAIRYQNKKRRDS